MKRLSNKPRLNWQQTVESQGLLYHSIDDVPYWDESAYYQFSMNEVLEIEKATNELYEMCLAAAEHIISNKLYARFGLSKRAISLIESSWEREPPSLYGRFDLAFDKFGKIKLLEFNADTPTALVEAAVVQWFWKQDCFPFSDQFNSVHEKLIAQWTAIKEYIKNPVVHFCHMDNWEDWMTVTYLRDTAHSAGISNGGLLMEELGWNGEMLNFRDLEDRTISSLFKLYPWEWFLEELPTGADATIQNSCNVIEPAWRMLWSNKAILAILWELYPGHDNLLPAYLDGPRDMTSYVQKPILSREGANVRIVKNGREVVNSDGPYDTGASVYQEYAEIPEYDGNIPVLGSWYITDQGAAGMGIRESKGPITNNLSRFVPHIIGV